jgi:alkanesulfonate monooxygenase SsuD/methylene tetrahydromethanopterin reductase-like flavin-dependent oxidoreductase (luciferase family)
MAPVSEMRGPTRYGLGLFPDAPAAELVDAVVAAEDAGFDEVWVADEGPMRDPAVVLAAAATRTSRIRLCVGIASVVLHHPGALAARWKTLDELAPGRAVLGIGLGGHLSLEPFGLSFERPVATMRSAIRTIRAVCAASGGEGYTHMAHAAPERRVPIFVASKGPQINGLAAREADGVFLSGFDLDVLDEPVAWARSAGRPVDVALYASVRFVPTGRPDPTSLVGSPERVAEGLRALMDRHNPEAIGMALVDGADVSTMVTHAAKALAALRN